VLASQQVRQPAADDHHEPHHQIRQARQQAVLDAQQDPRAGNSHVVIIIVIIADIFSRWRGTVVERRSLAGELSLSCARPAADG